MDCDFVLLLFWQQFEFDYDLSCFMAEWVLRALLAGTFLEFLLDSVLGLAKEGLDRVADVMEPF